MNVVGYSRVSKREQAENTHALEQHIDRLRSAGATQIITDVESGLKADRKGYLELLQLIEQGEVEKLIVTELSRLGRSLFSLKKAIDLIVRHDVKFVSLAEKIDLDTAIGKFQFNLAGALAEMESDRLSERSKNGWAFLRKRQVAMSPPFGYIKTTDGKHALDRQPYLCLLETKEELSRAALASDTIDSFFRCGSLRACIKHLNGKYGIQTYNHDKRPGYTARGLFRWSCSGLKHWLTSPVLRGHLIYRRDSKNSEIIYDTHRQERLLTNGQYQEVERILAQNRAGRGWGAKRAHYPLSGLVECADCRGSCYSMTSGKLEYYYFQCKNAKLNACPNKKAIRAEKAEAAVAVALTTRAEQIAQIAATPDEPIDPPELIQLKSQLAALQSIPGSNPAIESAIAQLLLQVKSQKSQVKSTYDLRLTTYDLLVETFGSSTFFECLPEDEKRRIFHALVERVIIRDGEVMTIRLKV